jgi:hypothetical protein
MKVRATTRTTAFILGAALVGASLLSFAGPAAAPASASVPCWTAGTPDGDAYVVPSSGVSAVTITVYGQEGHGWIGLAGVDGPPFDDYGLGTPEIEDQSSGGLGAVVEVTLAVTPGEVLQPGHLSGAPGGASPGIDKYYQEGLNGYYQGVVDNAGGGGNAEFVTESTGGCATAVAVAGGGGGGGAYSSPGNGGNADTGSGAAGGGNAGDNSQEDGGGGGGGSSTGGGGGGAHGHSTSACHNGNDGSGGGFGTGGTGADGDNPITDPAGHVYCSGGGGAGGGGAGYYFGGGGGSGYDQDGSGGGGGGGSFYSPDSTLVSETQAAPNTVYSDQAPVETIVPTYTTTSTISASPNPAYVGQPVTITVNVVNSQGNPVPGGTVQFIDEVTPIGTGTVSNGVATFTTSSLSLGTHGLQADFLGYSGDSEGDAPGYTHSTDVGGVLLPYQMYIQAVPLPPDFNEQPGDSTATYGGGFIFEVSDNATTLITNQWQYSATGATGTFADIPGVTGDDYYVPSGVQLSQAGYYRVAASDAGGTTYSSAAHLTVSKAQLHIVANNKSMVYGTSEPALDVTYGDGNTGEDFDPGDTAANSLTGTLTCTTTPATITATTPVGDYPINCSGQSSANYVLTYVAGTLDIHLATQAITFAFDQGTGIKVGNTATLSATGGGSGNPVTFTVDSSSTAGACSLSGTNGVNASFTGAGTCVIDANQAGTGLLFSAAPQVQQSISVTKTSQAITFTPPGGFTYVGTTYVLDATGGASGNPVTYSLDTSNDLFTPNVCSLSGPNNDTVTLDHASTPGYCIISADQAGNSIYDAAPTVLGYMNSFSTYQPIVFDGPTEGYVGQTVSLFASGGTPTSPISFSQNISPTSVCVVTTTSVSGDSKSSTGSVTFTGPGTCYVAASTPGDSDWWPGYVMSTVTVTLAPQTITFNPPTNVTVGSATVTATGGASGNPVIFSIDATSGAGVCASSGTHGSHIDYLAAGTCVIDANQAGNTTYAAGTAQASVVVGAQTISFTPPTTAVYGSTTTLSPTGGGSGNPVTLTVDAVSAANCSIAGDVVTYTQVGNCVLDANQVGTAAYLDAPQVQRTVAVTPAAQSIVFGTVSGAVVGGGATISATGGGSGNPVVFTLSDLSGPGVCSLSGATLTFTAVGSCIVLGSEAASTNYSGAATPKTITVGPGSQSISFSAPDTATYGGSATLTASGGASGNPVIFSVDATSSPAACAVSGTDGSTLRYTNVGTCVLDANQAADTNYNAAAAAADSVVISPAPLTITANPNTMIYGGTVPSITAAYSAFVSPDTSASLADSPNCTTDATATSDVGTSYVTTCSGADSPKYDISYVAGAMSITAAPLQITADSPTTTYGVVPTVGSTIEGYAAGDGIADLTTTPACTTSSTASSPVGTGYVTSCTGAVDPNYAISYVTGVATIDPATLTITADDQSTVYGAADATPTPSYAGFENNESPTDLAVEPTCVSAVVATSPVGSYTIDCNGAAGSNYAIGYVSGTYSVTPAPLTVTASNTSSKHGYAVPAVTASYQGLTNGDSVGDLVQPATCRSAATSASHVGTYANTCAGAVDANYSISYVSGTATIKALPSVPSTIDGDSIGPGPVSGLGSAPGGSGSSKSKPSGSGSGSGSGGSTHTPNASAPTGQPTAAGFPWLLLLVLLLIVLVGGIGFFVWRSRTR